MTSSPTDVDAEKRTMRQAAQSRRDAISLSQRNDGAAALATTGISFAAPPAVAIVSAYSAMGTEIDPLPLLTSLAQQGYRTALPVVTPRGNPLTFRAWNHGEPLVARTWGILEPTATSAVVEPDVLLVPLLAFDQQGYRLGYGGGYYDRTLQRLRQMKPIVAIGLAFGEQQVPHVPRGVWDQRLDALLTPQFALTFR